MPSRNDELLEDYKTAIRRVRLHQKLLLTVTFVGAIAAGSKAGFVGAKDLFSWFFGEPKRVENFVRWYPVAVAMFSIFILIQHWHRMLLREQVVRAIGDDGDQSGLTYRVRDDLKANFPGLLGQLSQKIALVFVWVAAGISMFWMWLPFHRQFTGWSNYEKDVDSVKSALRWSEQGWVWAVTLAIVLSFGLIIFLKDLKSNRRSQEALDESIRRASGKGGQQKLHRNSDAFIR